MSQVSLRVAEAQSRDVGRGIARIDPTVSSGMGLSAGRFVAKLSCRDFHGNINRQS